MSNLFEYLDQHPRANIGALVVQMALVSGLNRVAILDLLVAELS